MIRYRIQLVESERGWGQEYWSEDFETYEEAVARIKEVNAQNTAAKAPDWYIAAETTVEAIEV